MHPLTSDVAAVQKLYLHVIMDCVKDPKTGHFQFKRQEVSCGLCVYGVSCIAGLPLTPSSPVIMQDHIFWLESMLYHTPWITLYIGPLIMEPYVKPALGGPSCGSDLYFLQPLTCCHVICQGPACLLSQI